MSQNVPIKLTVSETQKAVFDQVAEIEGLPRNQMITYIAYKYCKSVLAQESTLQIQEQMKGFDFSQMQALQSGMVEAGIFDNNPEMIKQLEGLKEQKDNKAE